MRFGLWNGLEIRYESLKRGNIWGLFGNIVVEWKEMDMIRYNRRE